MNITTLSSSVSNKEERRENVKQLQYPSYSAAIRTLGSAGEKYRRLLNSLLNQTIPPKRIIVYLAEGYKKPEETIAIEDIVYVKKGMVAQRALNYDEIDTEWLLLLDDDIEIEPHGVEQMFSVLNESSSDVCAMDGFPHDNQSLLTQIKGIITLSSFPRLFNRNNGYTLSWMGPDWYNPQPRRWAYSNTNSGNAIMIKKSDFKKIHFEEDLWLDDSPYALPEDSVMFYKMHLCGLKIVTMYNTLFKHLDAKTSMIGERLYKVIYSEAKNSKIFRDLYVFPSYNFAIRIIAKLLVAFRASVKIIQYKVLSNDANKLQSYKKGIRDAKEYLSNRRNH